MKNFSSYKLFLFLAVIGIIILLIFTYLSINALDQDFSAKENVENFYHQSKNLTIGNLLVFIFLLSCSNIIYFKNNQWSSFIITGIIFSAFTLCDWWWLSEKIFHYKKANGLWLGEFSLGPIVGILIVLIGLVLVIGNYFILKKLFKSNADNSVPQASNTDKKTP